MGLTEESGDLLQGAAALITDLDGTLTETELLKAMSYARVMAQFFDCHQPDALRILSCEDRDIPALSKRVRTAVTSAERKLALPSPPSSPPPSVGRRHPLPPGARVQRPKGGRRGAGRLPRQCRRDEPHRLHGAPRRAPSVGGGQCHVCGRQGAAVGPNGGRHRRRLAGALPTPQGRVL
eukprot:TRINITY_DN1053_c1_g1_i1.p2 TRINITY_DN1053_c1_g1~~TRINITY_DN1053_c1_g1_i1.p2  ORF type:complete len:179 (+),score=26.34 TRINITY_DN1053_c1_g1_i1:410-946(+)